ncbi:hypothetical protein LXL04_034972 [Taraxacum kok-saghyz]
MNQGKTHINKFMLIVKPPVLLFRRAMTKRLEYTLDEMGIEEEYWCEFVGSREMKSCALSGGNWVQREKGSKTAGSFVEEKLRVCGFLNPLKGEGEEEKGGRRGRQVPGERVQQGCDTTHERVRKISGEHKWCTASNKAVKLPTGCKALLLSPKGSKALQQLLMPTTKGVGHPQGA